jgi:Fe-S-cluster containining protein
MAREMANLKGRRGRVACTETCHRCGACCANVGCPPFRDDELAALPAEMRYILEWFGRCDPQRNQDVIPCTFLNLATRKCLIYAQRPQACRDFRPGSHLCREHRRAFVPCLDQFTEGMKTRH